HLLDVDNLEAVLLGQSAQELLVGDEAARHGDLAGELVAALGFVEDFPELVFVDEAKVDEDLAQAPAAGGRARFLDEGGLRRGAALLGAWFGGAGGLGGGGLDRRLLAGRWLDGRRRRLGARLGRGLRLGRRLARLRLGAALRRAGRLALCRRPVRFLGGL